MLAASIVAAVYLWPVVSRPPAPVAAVAAPATETVPGESVQFDFLNPSLGWAAATMEGQHSLWIYSTTDGARTWHRSGAINDLVNPSPVSSLQLFDRTHGLLILAPDLLAYRTSDGGRTWAMVRTPDGSIGVQFVDPLHGWAQGAFKPDGTTSLLSTVDGGRMWIRLPDPPAVTGQPVFRSVAEGWWGSPSLSARVLRTDDGGLSWTADSLPVPALPAVQGYEAGTTVTLLPGNGVVARAFPACIQTPCVKYVEADFVSLGPGSSWRWMNTPPNTAYDDVSFQDSTHWWLITGGNLYKTADAGDTWRLVSNRIEYDTLKPTILDSNHAWVELQSQNDISPGQRPSVGWSLVMTADGGLSWKDVTVPVPD